MVELAGKTKHDRGFGDFWPHVLVAEGACDVGLDPVVVRSGTLPPFRSS